MPGLEQRIIGAADVADWMHAVIAYAVDLPKAVLTSIALAPAGQPIEAHFDDPELEHAYRVRLWSLAPGAYPVETIFILSGKSAGLETVPEWDGRSCPAPVFQNMMLRAGLRSAYPARSGLWRFVDPRRRVGDPALCEPR